MAMEDLNPLFFYQESVDELKQKLLYMAYELQSARMQADEEARKNKEGTENIKNLLHLLQIAYKERDEAKEQLHKLKMSSSAVVAPPIRSPERRTSSGVTESNSLSDTTTYNNNNNNSGDSLYDVISPVIKDFPTPVVAVRGGSTDTGKVVTIDPETQIIYDLAKGKPLPKRGKLLEAVMEAGPLLQTLMVAGSLPRWRNPPPLQPLQAPPVGISGFDCSNKKQLAGGGYAKLLPCGSSEFLTNSGLNFGSGGGGFGGSGVCLNSSRGAGVVFGGQMISTPKRQRIQ